MPAWLLALAFLSGPWAATPPNPCTNGSFEELAPNGFPLGWEPVGQTVQAVHDVHSVHSGKTALRLLRTPDTKAPETGLNRAWKPKSGEQGAMIAQLKGGIEFWYKALSAAEGTRLTIQAIPMNAVPIEGTDSPRAIFDVPKDHIGDGQWHQGRLKYDFTGDPKARWVHFAARILGAAGELLLDDFAYVETVGPLLRISRLRLDEDPKRPGERCTISALIENVGDGPADTRATLSAQPGLRASPVELRLGGVAAESKAKASWIVQGRREGPSTIRLTVSSGALAAADVIAVAPKLVLESFGPTAPVATVGETIALECVIRNAGNAILLSPAVDFALGESKASRGLPELLPGQAWVARAMHTPQAQSPEAPVHAEVRAANVREKPSQGTTLIVGAAVRLPAPSGRLRAVAAEHYALIENERVRLAFRRNAFGFGVGELAARTPHGWRTVAWLLHLAPFTYQSEDGDTLRESGGFTSQMPRAEATESVACLRFADARRFLGGSRWTGVAFSLSRQNAWVLMDCELGSDVPMNVACLGGPLLYVLDREEAVFPGLEWLVGDELSSSSLDIAANHPDRDRSMPPPSMVVIPAIGVHGRHGAVGLLWDVHQKWDGTRDRPSVIFESPDVRRGQRSHLAGLLLPAGPEFIRGMKPGDWQPYPLEAGQTLRVRGLILADGEARDALAAVDEWIRIYGLPEPLPLPHGSYEKEIEFSMQAYLKSLWVPETKEWWTSKGGGPIMSKKGRPHHFAADLLLGALVSPDEAVRKQCRERAEEVAPLLHTEPRLDAMRFPGRFDLAIANPAHAAGLLATMGDDGAWRFDADREGHGPFVGKDYHELGPDNAVEVGTCANKAFQVLRYARIAGDAEAYERMQKTLRLMETFRVPRAAQVWEVPVHTPDLLAAADAVDAYIEAYRFSGDERWLRDAVTWARRGIPFIYLWNPPDKPWLLGASIPVYGATWFTCSWFGRPVQWNGLRYATALLKLAEYDQSKDWRRLAELIIRSAILQQDSEGENVALWPDNISAIDGKKCPWVFVPRQIIQNILLLHGRDEEPSTVMLWAGRPRPAKGLFSFLSGPERRIHISATARISDTSWDGDLLTFKAGYPPGEEGCVLIANVARPTIVLLDGRPLAERAEVEKGAEPGWRYDDALAYLSIRVGPPAPAEGYGLKAALRTWAVRVEGTRYRRVDRLPTVVERLDFTFARSAEGWTAAHDISGLAVRDGALCGTATGSDPYIVRSLVHMKGEACPVLLVRLRATAGRSAQLFWTTKASPDFEEAKSLRFPIIADGQFHDYRLEVGKHAQWAGQTITALRLDPGDAPGEFAVAHIRGERK